jgi:DNA mismatch endonuclease (patch repair protein)
MFSPWPKAPRFWEKKLSGNKARDRRVNRELRKLGWRVVRIWEHDLAKRGAVCARRIMTSLRFPSRQAKSRRL